MAGGHNQNKRAPEGNNLLSFFEVVASQGCHLEWDLVDDNYFSWGFKFFFLSLVYHVKIVSPSSRK